MKWNTLILTLLCSLVSLFCLGQENDLLSKKQSIGLAFSTLGNSDLISFENFEGGGSYDSKYHYSVGVYYQRYLNDWLQIESGIEYSNQNLDFVIGNPPPDRTLPTKFSMLDIPIALRMNFAKFFFINMGTLMTIDIADSYYSDPQSGLGVVLGFGINFMTQSGINLFVNPYTEAHSLIAFNKQQFHHHLLESGIRFGVGYRF